MKTNHKIFLLVLGAVFVLGSCKKYLDIKPDAKLQVPSTMEDCQALLADDLYTNTLYPYVGELSADNFYMPFNTWNAQRQSDRDLYVWKTDADPGVSDWNSGYKRVLNANQVLAVLDKITPSVGEQERWNTLKGSALFLRAFACYSMAELWTKPYNTATAGTDLGIPIKLTPDINEAINRGTVKQTYERILQDLQQAADLLPARAPDNKIAKTALLTKSAPMAALARVYLSMSDFNNAFQYANACLQQYSVLMDYKNLNPSSNAPIAQLNAEVIFDAESNFSIGLNNGRIDSVLYASYKDDDIRKQVFFRTFADNTHNFKGGYTGTPGYILFTGLATDEVYLIRAECYARAGNTAASLTDLNNLMRNRSAAGFQDLTAVNASAALDLVLQERRKELLYRGVRWYDLRRLNKENRFSATLKRKLNNQEYLLPPNDLRYVLLLPIDLINKINLPQNPR